MKKKRISFVLCAVLVCFLLATTVACDKKRNEGDEHPLQVAVLSDIHLMTPDEIKDPTGKNFVYYTNKLQTMLPLSEALYKSTVDQLIEQKPDVVLMTGDLSQTGSKKSLQVIADGCKRLKEAGIKVFVTPGINDLSEYGTTFDGDKKTEKEECVTLEEFVEMFADYGYNQAISRDEETLTYFADLDETHRLLVLDSISLFDYELNSRDVSGVSKSPVLSNGTLQYVDEGLAESVDLRKEVLVMSYLPLSNEVGDVYGQMTKRFVVAIDQTEERSIIEMLMYHGVQYAVTGHLHAKNHTVYDDKVYFDLHDYTASCTTCYPLETIYLTADEDQYIVEHKALSSVKAEYLPSYLSAEDRLAFLADPVAFSKQYLIDHIDVSANAIMHKEGHPYGFITYLLVSLDYIDLENIATDAKAIALGRCFGEAYEDLMQMTLYGEENSIESVCLEYGIFLPDIGKNMTVKEYFADVFCRMFTNEIVVNEENDETTVLKYIGYTAIRNMTAIDISEQLQELRPDVGIKYFDLSSLADGLFHDDQLCLKVNAKDPDGNTYSIIASVLSVLEPVLIKADIKVLGTRLSVLGVDQTTIDSLLGVLDNYLEVVLALFDDYSTEDNTLYGLKIRSYLDFSAGTIKIGDILGIGMVDIFAKDLLF